MKLKTELMSSMFYVQTPCGFITENETKQQTPGSFISDIHLPFRSFTG